MLFKLSINIKIVRKLKKNKPFTILPAFTQKDSKNNLQTESHTIQSHYNLLLVRENVHLC